MFSSIFAISPVDGRYRALVKDLSNYFSEGALHKYRVLVEIEYFIKLCDEVVNDKFPLNEDQKQQLRLVYKNFSEDDAQTIKDSEKITNHDVKAVEYFIKDKLRKLGLESYTEWVHFGLTSQDINNTAIPLSIKEGLATIIIPQTEVLKEFDKITSTYVEKIDLIKKETQELITLRDFLLPLLMNGQVKVK